MPTALRVLRPYQAEAVDRIKSNKSTALYMEMRLGKTVCVIRSLEGCRVLVVAPMAGLWAWKRELALEGRGDCVAEIVGTREQRQVGLERRKWWNLINYEGILSFPEILGENWDAVVLDECRRIANPKAKTTKLLVSWSFQTDGIKKVILSGNPAPESPLEYFEQMRFLYGSFLGCKNYWQFRNAYFRELAPHEWVPKPGCVQTIKEAVHDAATVLTRREAGIKDRKIYETRTVQLGKETRRTYEKIKSDFVAEWKGAEIKNTKWVPVQYLWLQQISSGFLGRELVDQCKIRELLELLKGELKNESVVVWFRFNAGLLACLRSFKNANERCVRIYGSMSPHEREDSIDRFRRGQARILLCQIKCAKEAIDLSTSSTAIYFSNSCSLDERIQSEDRILNPSKKEPLLYVDLVAEDTVDEDIVELLQNKKRESRFFLTKLLEKLREQTAV